MVEEWRMGWCQGHSIWTARNGLPEQKFSGVPVLSTSFSFSLYSYEVGNIIASSWGDRWTNGSGRATTRLPDTKAHNDSIKRNDTHKTVLSARANWVIEKEPPQGVQRVRGPTVPVSVNFISMVPNSTLAQTCECLLNKGCWMHEQDSKQQPLEVSELEKSLSDSSQESRGLCVNIPRENPPT